jgi:hypothetical protein
MGDLMTNRAFYDIPANTWVKVASAVISGSLRKKIFGTQYLYTYIDTGDTAPTDGDESAGILFDDKVEKFAYASASDVYVYADGKDGRVCWDSEALGEKIRDKRPVDLYMITTAGQPAQTTTSAPAAQNATELTLTSVTGITTGQFFGLFDVTSKAFYFGTVLAAPVGNVVQIDSPLCCAYPTGSIFQAVSKNINANGSVTPVTYSIAPQTTIRALRVLGSMTTGSPPDYSTFGDIAGGITKGIVLRRNNGVVDNIWNVKKNADFAGLAYDLNIFRAANPQGVDGLAFRYTLNGEDKHGTSILIPPGDRLDLIVQDDLSSLTSFEITVQGYEE